MKRFLVLSFVAVVMLSLTGCVPHTTGETEVGVRTCKLALFGQKGVEDRVYAPGATYFFPAVYQRLECLRHQAAEPGDDVFAINGRPENSGRPGVQNR